MVAEKLRKIYEAAGADALFIETDFLRRYLTGFNSSDGYVILAEDSCMLVVDPRYYEAAVNKLRDTCVQVIEGTHPKALELVKDYQTLGVPFPFTDLVQAELLQKAGHKLKDCMPAFKQIMTIKSPEEIKELERACEIAEGAFLRLLPEIKEGMTEREVAGLLEYHMRKLGSSGVSFDTIVAFGEGSSVPHHATGRTQLKFGDVVLIDFGCKVAGYCSDMTRTFLFGDDKKHGEFKRVYSHVLRAHELVKEKVVAGMTGREADEIARGYLRGVGLDKYFTHTLGHGIGIQVHEYPVLSPYSNEVLQNGMVFSDEPGVYLAGNFGIRIEDSVHMQDGKVVSFMSKTDRNLIIL